MSDPTGAHSPETGPEEALTDLLALMRRLRDPDSGCPWDLDQTFATIAPYTVEEAYEVRDAIERRDWLSFREELGDLLFQVVFHARMAEEARLFDFADVARGLVAKMTARHPHVFGDASADADMVSRRWEDGKAAERAVKAQAAERRPSLLDDIPQALPALTRAVKMQKRAARIGFDWPSCVDVFAKLDEEITELQAEITETPDRERVLDELGDLLFVVANIGRHLDVDPEEALRRCNAKFTRRFQHIERRLDEQGAEGHQDLARLNALWDEAKGAEKAAATE